MNIETLQKRKFLNNIYKLYYSLGSKPSDHELKKAFNDYFSVNKFGEPVYIDINRLRATAKVDHHILNELMANTLLNLEVLYDCVMDNNQQIFSTITALNNKIDGLRAKRKELESKVDQLLFANSNSDGFFSSFLENFSTLSNIDMGLTTAYVDIINNNATIPKLTSQFSRSIAGQFVNIPNVKQSIVYNNSNIFSNKDVQNFDLVFDGLNDTFWSYTYNVNAPGVVSMSLDIPLGSSVSISKIEGSIISVSPCAIYVRATNSAGIQTVKYKDSKDDYNRFSFIFPNDVYSQITLTLVKTEPDKVIQSQSSPYAYSFGIRELTISADYYTERSSLVSVPISLPTNDNSLLSISAVSMDVKQQSVPGTEMSFFIAKDLPNYQSISNFNWIQVQPNEFGNHNSSSVINLLDSIYQTEFIDLVSENAAYDYVIIPTDTTAQNVNDLNPVTIPYSTKSAYRVASLDNNKDYLQPYLMSGLNNYSSYWLSSNSLKYSSNLYRSLDSWAEIISAKSNDLHINTVTNTSTIFSSTLNGPGSEILQTNISVNESIAVSHDIYKLNNDFNLSVYLNGALIADLPKGQSMARVEWNFIKGTNNISILFDYDITSKISFELMHGANITDYGTIFLDYFNYIDPLQFRRSADQNLNTFTIDTIFGSKQILANKEISKRTILKYYLNKSDEITSVRYRVDFNRYSNPLQTPVLDAIRIKFKHNDL